MAANKYREGNKLRSMPMPDDMWDTLRRFGAAKRMPVALLVRLAVTEFLEKREVPIVQDAE